MTLPYAINHSVQVGCTPSSNTQKAVIIFWLSKHNFPHTHSYKRELLLTIVNNCNSKGKIIQTDEIANQQGHMWYISHFTTVITTQSNQFGLTKSYYRKKILQDCQCQGTSVWQAFLMKHGKIV